MSNPFRTSAGGRINRARTLRFSFDGQVFSGFEGDTLASALLANGVHLVGRSFKYHRPRGILACGSEEPNALVSVRRDAARFTPNLRATQVELYEGLDAHSQNRRPSLAFDLGALNALLSPFIPAGFYYKTFMWPRRAWKSLYEPSIRAAAGLGVAPALADPDRYVQRFAHCDVLIVGAGPAGLAAALTAAQSGARVMLCDEQSELGGSLLADTQASIDGRSAQLWLKETLQQLSRSPDVTLLSRTTAFGYFPHNLIGLNERLTDHISEPHPDAPRERLWHVRAKQVVLATGAIDRPLVFPGNDRPGIMLASAAREFVNRYGVRPGSRAVVVAACDEAYRSALDLQAAGVTIAAIADVRSAPEGAVIEAAQRAGLPIQTRTTVTGTSGRLRVSAIQLAPINVQGRAVPRTRKVSCDLVLMSGGYTPSVHLFSQSRGKLTWDPSIQAFVPGAPAERVRCAGACRGVFALAAVLEDGAAAGYAAAGTKAHAAGFTVSALNASVGSYTTALPQFKETALTKAFVDWQNDVTARDLTLATREGFHSIEHIKRYTTTGMATDQGKISNLNALGIVSSEMGKSIPEVGLTTFRMPFTPVTFGAFAGLSRGELFDPVRTTPIHDWARERGAVFEDVGLWKRARFFPQPSETMHAAVARECRAVRQACGMFDASTLGKIEVVGKDAATFLDRLYVNSWTTLAVGRARYGILLRDDGFIFDDGVVARIANDRFHVTTTTGGAARVLALMEDYLQTEWPDLSVWLTSTTEQWAVISVQGPQARCVLESLVEGVDLSAAALPHMSVAHGKICGAPLRLLRVSFTGELGFEVNVPSDYGRSVWEAIHKAGGPYGITPYGTEATHVLRAEKGYIIVGQDTDGTVTPDDAGVAWAIGKNKTDFVGKRSLQRAAMHVPERKQLVGLLTSHPRVVLEEGAQIIAQRNERPIGHVTSSYDSPVLGRSIALALVSGGRARMGQRLYVPMPQGDTPIEVTSPVFYDPQGKRLHD
jgi:sarcosine oxidase, subunit alpha